jgi:hypothetical protein
MSHFPLVNPWPEDELSRWSHMACRGGRGWELKWPELDLEDVESMSINTQGDTGKSTVNDSEKLNERKRVAETLRMCCLDAYIEGLCAYAWWKNGVQYVGTCGTTLKDAVEKARSEYDAMVVMCTTCAGQGEVHLRDEGSNGMYWQCPACNGKGKVRN